MDSKSSNNSSQVRQGVSAGPAASMADASKREPLLDSTEAAQLLRIHPKTLQRMARKGEIPAVQIGKLWRFRVSALNDWLEKIAS